MKRCTFVYKLNIYFNRRIRNWSVKLTQTKLNTEEIKLFWSWILWCILAWNLACYHYFFCAVLNLLFIHFCDFYTYLLLRLGYNKKDRFTALHSINMENRYVIVAFHTILIRPLFCEAFENKLYQLFYDLKNSVVQVKRTCRFCVICISYIDGKPIVKITASSTLLKDF